MSVERVRPREGSIFEMRKSGYCLLNVTNPETDKTAMHRIHIGYLKEVKRVLGVERLDAGDVVKIDRQQYESIMKIAGYEKKC